MTTTQHITTAQQLAQAGDLGPCELLRGELIMMSPSHMPHARIGARIIRFLGAYVDQRSLGEVTNADGGYLIEHDPDTVRSPGVGFVSAARMPPEGVSGFFPGARGLGRGGQFPLRSRQ